MKVRGLPEPQGLYTPENEHDNCGVGFLANIKNRKSHDIIRQGLEILVNLDHRGAVGADELAGDGAGILLQVPDRLFREDCSRESFRIPRIRMPLNANFLLFVSNVTEKFGIAVPTRLMTST